MSDDSGSRDDSDEPDADVRRDIEELQQRIAAEQAGAGTAASAPAASAPSPRRRRLGRPATIVVVMVILVALVGFLVAVAIGGGSKRASGSKGTPSTTSPRRTSSPSSTSGTTSGPPTVVPPTSVPPTAPTTPAPPPAPARVPSAPRQVQVVFGDSFWTLATRLAADRLHESPSAAQIVPVWQALIAANSSRLPVPGNPDLIYPGQVFLLPPL